ncbi:hypothetical protein LQZ21_08570 [Treponema sp. TIM-1]|uniref:hypothetical protein n=1 Tax=Treponema sp. TIM-1 TaxID=2898417 RepID=UPI00397EEB0F
MREKTIERIKESKIIAIMRGMEEDLILPLAEALLKGGISMMEINFNQAKPESFQSTRRSIEAVNKKFSCGVVNY